MHQLSEMYFGTAEPTINDTTFATLVEIFTDAWFQMPTIYTSLKLAQKAENPIFLYKYGYHGSMNFCDLIDLNLAKFMVKVCIFVGSTSAVYRESTQFLWPCTNFLSWQGRYKCDFETSILLKWPKHEKNCLAETAYFFKRVLYSRVS